MAVATRSGAGPSTDASRGAVMTFTILGGLIVAGYFALTFLYDRVKPSPQLIYEALVEAEFDQALPENLRVTGGSSDKRPGAGYVSIHLNTPVDPQGFDGNQAQIAYQVFDDAAAARGHLKGLRTSAALWEESRPTRRGRGWFERSGISLPLAEDNICIVMTDRVQYCQILVGRVIIDITSYLELLELGNSSYRELAKAALAHLREAVPGVD